MRVVGLMSGTSMDGIDAALVEIRERPAQSTRPSVRLLGHHYDPYPISLRRRLLLLAAGEPRSVAETCHLNAYLGELFAQTTQRLLRLAGLSESDVDLIGSHGQTVHHLPGPRREGSFSIRSTLQLGEPAIIAERTGITTVADFRQRDIAAGGEGAPLTPLAHDCLFRHPSRSRAVLNLGGIGNLTYLPAGDTGRELIAFDTGPGNLLIDGFMRYRSRGRLGMDRDGRLAARGKIHDGLLSKWMKHPFFRRPPPKSAGREQFGETFLARAVADCGARRLSDADQAATLTALTARSVAEAIRRFILPRGEINEIVVGGGGCLNPFLLKLLVQAVAPVTVRPFEAFGYSSRAFEAMAFALLAYETALGRPGNRKSATGARHAALLGAIVPGRRWPLQIGLPS